ncbi:MAG TPA: NAD(P)-binding protein, partial [Cytophagaceae bacterium]
MEKFDVVIVGSGLGGLECANILSKEGYSVCVLEKNRQFGGNLQTFVREKCILDTGVHYIGGLSEGQNLNQIFKYLGIMSKLKLKKMDEEGFDVISFEGDNEVYKYAQGYDRFYDTLLEKFPKEKYGLRKYCDKLLEISLHFPLFNLKVASGEVIQSDALEIDTKGYIDSIITDPKLRNVLAGTNPLYAGEADMTPLYVHALINHSYIESAWKCVDGGSQIERHLSKNLKANGGVMRNYSEVNKFLFDGDKIRFAQLTNGECVEGKYFISNLHPALTIEMVGQDKIRKAYRSRIQALENTTSVFVVNLILKENSFKYLNFNRYHYSTNDVWACIKAPNKCMPSGFAMYTPASSKSEEYADSIILLSYMDYSDVEKWGDSHHTIPRGSEDRGEGYSEYKNHCAENLIDMLEKLYPDIRSKIKSY